MILADNSNVKQQDKAAGLLTDNADLLVEINELTRVVESKSEVISKQKKHIAILEEALRLSKIKRFAPSSEQSQQASLFDEAENEADSDGNEELELELEVGTDDLSEDDNQKTINRQHRLKPRKNQVVNPFQINYPANKFIFI